MSFKKILVVLILLFSFLLRYWKLDSNPSGFFCDEALMGIEALSILNSGKDSNGIKYPLFFQGFNFDNISPYQVYLTIPSVGLLGLNEKSVRLVPVILGTFEIFIFYLFLKELLPGKFALLGSLLLSISPWHFHLTRINMGDYYSWTLLTLVSYLFLIKALKKKRLIFFVLSALFFGFTSYSYTPARLITPLLFSFSLIITLLTTKYFKIGLLMITLYTITIIPFIHFHLTDPHSFQRIKDTMGLDLKQKNSAKEVKIYPDVTYKYLMHYSYTFFFAKGDADFPGQFIRRHSVADLGLLYPYQKLFIIIGLIWLLIQVFKNKKYELLFVIFMLLLFPVADSLTKDKTPFATRSYLGVIPFHLLIAFGIYASYRMLVFLKLWKNQAIRKALLVTFFLIVVNSVLTLTIKFQQNPLTTSDYWGWQFGARDIVTYFKQVEPQYDQLIMEPKFNAPDVFFKFYAPETCKKCVIGDFKAYNPAKKQLFALSAEYLAENKISPYTIHKIIYYPNKSVAFKIIELHKPL
ncbi:glycosyltransferase family 39 protein [Candidatus Gottesmanbacteria bacterium]|nr:glycosyltransferase family 39 protein [Candidatus Gottesmanbacteria bacterium]